MKKLILIITSILIIFGIFLIINIFSQNNHNNINDSKDNQATIINDRNPDANPEPTTEISLTGELTYVHNNGKQVLLSFYNPHQGHIGFIIEKEHWTKFHSTFQTEMGENKVGLFAIGQTITVTGKIDYYQGDEAIYITDPTQIQIEINETLSPEQL